jgi:Flp pilus assembly pilin Flp
MAKSLRFVERLWFGEEGATMAEYAILIGFVATLCATAVGTFSAAVGTLFQRAVNSFH